MKYILHLLKLTLFVCAISQLTGCTVILYSYIRNLTDSPVEITIKSKQSPIIVRGHETNGFNYKNELLKINKETYKQLSDSLSYFRVDPSTIQLTLPAHSTVMLTPGIKLKWHDNDAYEILLKQNEKTDSLRIFVGENDSLKQLNDTKEYFKRKGAFVKHIYYYDYKNTVYRPEKS